MVSSMVQSVLACYDQRWHGIKPLDRPCWVVSCLTLYPWTPRPGRLTSWLTPAPQSRLHPATSARFLYPRKPCQVSFKYSVQSLYDVALTLSQAFRFLFRAFFKATTPVVDFDGLLGVWRLLIPGTSLRSAFILILNDLMKRFGKGGVGPSDSPTPCPATGRIGWSERIW